MKLALLSWAGQIGPQNRAVGTRDKCATQRVGSTGDAALRLPINASERFLDGKCGLTHGVVAVEICIRFMTVARSVVRTHLPSASFAGAWAANVSIEQILEIFGYWSDLEKPTRFVMC